MSKEKLAVIALISANLIWGAASPIFKWSLTSIEPFTLAFLRFFLAALILLPFVVHKLSIKRRDFLALFILSLFGIGVNISFFFLGLQLTSSINAPIIASSGPIFLILGSVLFLHEKLSKKVCIGTLISLFGVLLIIMRPLFEKGFDGSIVGNLFFVVSTIASVVYTLILKKMTKTVDVLSLTFWSFVIGSALFLPFVGWEAQTTGIIKHVDLPAIFGILYGAIFSSAIAYFLYTFALAKLVASEVGVFVYLDPVIAVLIAIPLLGETITFSFLLGSALVFFGIFVSEGRLHYHPIHKLIRH